MGQKARKCRFIPLKDTVRLNPVDRDTALTYPQPMPGRSSFRHLKTNPEAIRLAVSPTPAIRCLYGTWRTSSTRVAWRSAIRRYATDLTAPAI